MTSLEVTGHIKLVIEDGKIKTEDGSKFHIENTRGELRVRPAGGSSNISSVIYSGGSSYIVNNSSNGVSMINGDVYINGSSFNNKVVINGVDMGNVIREEVRLRKMGKSLLDAPSSGATAPIREVEVDDGSVTSYNLTTVINSIEVRGSGSVNIKTKIFLSTNHLAVDITGSGSVLLPGTQLSNLSVKISGSGSLDGRQTKVNRATFVITGSGDIEHCHCIQECNAKVSGSGSINCTADSHCSTDRSVTGSGKINIRKY